MSLLELPESISSSLFPWLLLVENTYALFKKFPWVMVEILPVIETKEKNTHDTSIMYLMSKRFPGLRRPLKAEGQDV